MALFHITTREEWDRAVAAGAYRAASLETEGFIHLSHDRQWLATANRFFRGRAGLVLLVLREDRLGGAVREEEADGDRFPHLYGPLPVAAVVEVHALPVGAGGAIEIPPALARREP